MAGSGNSEFYIGPDWDRGEVFRFATRVESSDSIQFVRYANKFAVTVLSVVL